MWEVKYKRTFLKELSKVPKKYREKIEKLVFEKIPKSQNPLSVAKFEKLKGYKEYYKIRIGEWRIGIRIRKNIIEFCRVRNRKDIYRYFP